LSCSAQAVTAATEVGEVREVREVGEATEGQVAPMELTPAKVPMEAMVVLEVPGVMEATAEWAAMALMLP
jgi:hypothetical protein